MKTNIIDNIILNTITLFFACVVMSIIDIVIFILIASTTFLFGSQLQLLPLQTLMFICSAIGGITFVMLDYNEPIIERAGMFGCGLKKEGDGDNS